MPEVTRKLLPGRLIASCGALALALQLSSCGGRSAPSPSPPRLVLLYATCSLNKDFLSPYNPEVTFTPRLEEFRRNALVLRRHQTESGHSGTAFASIFSGSQADHHGVFVHPTVLRPEIELIGETFRRHGYEVTAWLGHRLASGEFNYAQGADDSQVFERMPTADDPHLIEVLDRLQHDREHKAFLYTSFTLTHSPYHLAPVESFCNRYPDRCRVRSDRERFQRTFETYHQNYLSLSYDFPAMAERLGLTGQQLAYMIEVLELYYSANVYRLDQVFGRILDEVRRRGLFDDSVIVFTADHGETLFREGTHFKWSHGHQLAPEVLNVPLLIHAPGLRLGAGVYEGVTRSIDVFPTVAGLAGCPLPSRTNRGGVDLSAVLRGLEPPQELRAYSHTSMVPEVFFRRSQPWRLFRSFHPRIDPELMWVQVRDKDRVYQLRRDPDGELQPLVFDLESDPWQLNNRYDSADGEQRRAFRDLRSYRDRLLRAYHESERAEEVDEDRQEEILRSLGYID